MPLAETAVRVNQLERSDQQSYLDLSCSLYNSLLDLISPLISSGQICPRLDVKPTERLHIRGSGSQNDSTSASFIFGEESQKSRYTVKIRRRKRSGVRGRRKKRPKDKSGVYYYQRIETSPAVNDVVGLLTRLWRWICSFFSWATTPPSPLEIETKEKYLEDDKTAVVIHADFVEESKVEIRGNKVRQTDEENFDDEKQKDLQIKDEKASTEIKTGNPEQGNLNLKNSRESTSDVVEQEQKSGDDRNTEFYTKALVQGDSCPVVETSASVCCHSATLETDKPFPLVSSVEQPCNQDVPLPVAETSLDNSKQSDENDSAEPTLDCCSTETLDTHVLQSDDPKSFKPISLREKTFDDKMYALQSPVCTTPITFERNEVSSRSRRDVQTSDALSLPPGVLSSRDRSTFKARRRVQFSGSRRSSIHKQDLTSSASHTYYKQKRAAYVIISSKQSCWPTVKIASQSSSSQGNNRTRRQDNWNQNKLYGGCEEKETAVRMPKEDELGSEDTEDRTKPKRTYADVCSASTSTNAAVTKVSAYLPASQRSFREDMSAEGQHTEDQTSLYSEKEMSSNWHHEINETIQLSQRKAISSNWRHEKMTTGLSSRSWETTYDSRLRRQRNFPKNSDDKQQIRLTGMSFRDSSQKDMEKSTSNKTYAQVVLDTALDSSTCNIQTSPLFTIVKTRTKCRYHGSHRANPFSRRLTGRVLKATSK